ncbi:interaptin-like [Lucilia sericata]|uniref:interaptin-like n=1 Tax=Lucilia sericata TaxID=13632 RepID=UPI0018A807E9|nr:interaptin-like [Lucilia sericata]
MGAQQAKSGDEQETNVRTLQKQYTGLAREPTNGLDRMNENRKETVMSEQNLISASSPKRITVANFAKIKLEPRPVDEYSREEAALEEETSELVVEETIDHQEQNKSQQELEDQQNQLIYTENQNIGLGQAQEDSLPVVNNISPLTIGENSIILDTLPSTELSCDITNIQVKKELLETCGVTSESENVKDPLEIPQSSTISVLSDEEELDNSNRIYSAIKSETIDNDIEPDKNLEEENKDLLLKKENSDGNSEEDIDQQLKEAPKLVRNPFFKICNKKQQLKKEFIDEVTREVSTNKAIKTEHKSINEELNKTTTTKSPTSPENLSNAITVIHEETLQTSINLKELIIKSETLAAPDDILDFTTNNNLNINCLSCNLNSSLDVNLSNVETDFEEARSSQSIEEVKSTLSQNSSLDSLKYFTIIDLTSGEKSDLPIEDSSTITSTPKKQEKPKAIRGRPRKPGSLENYKFGKILKPKNRGGKPRSKTLKSKKISPRDTTFIASKKQILKNLPKISIKTRKKVNKQNSEKKTTKTSDDFPKPLKSEPHSLNKEQSIATELPKPMMFKSEKNININNDKSYLKPEFQPYVRLKRLKSEDLLVPLKTKPARKTRKRLSYHQMSNDNRRDFLIQHAFSLNQRAKLNRLSIDHDHLYYNNQQDQPSLYSRLTTPLSMHMDTANDSIAETDSKYFSPQELYSLFHSSTPDASSMFSGHIDSGVSTSTPSMQQRQTDYNKTLLLEIAAERAFINNHLIHFGYSPIQFDLFNNLNDLSIFLKYLFGSANMN